MSHVSFMMSLQTLISPVRAEGLNARIGVRMGDIGYVATLADGSLCVERREPTGCDVTFIGSPTELVAAIHGGLGLETIRVEGDMELARRFATLFPLPPKLAER
jgi:hypothetical protein